MNKIKLWFNKLLFRTKVYFIKRSINKELDKINTKLETILRIKKVMRLKNKPIKRK